MSFSRRNGYRRPYPDRVLLEQASDDVRLVLQEALVGDGEWVSAYRILCTYLREIPDRQIWSEGFAREPALEALEALEWYEVFDLLEEHAGGLVTELNESFARSGLAYEAERHSWVRSKCTIDVFDPEGVRLGLDTIDDEVAHILVDRFEPARIQYEMAVASLHGRPANYEKAISESVGALEAVARILAGQKDFGKNVSAIMADEKVEHGSLKATIGALYGFASQVPGARHGRWADPAVERADAVVAVRLAGIAIGYLLEGETAGRWPTSGSISRQT